MSTPIEVQLRGAGLRVTPGRLAVLAALDELPHSDAEALCRTVRSDRPMSVQSVHNVLADLTEAGVIHRIEPARSATTTTTTSCAPSAESSPMWTA